MVFHGSKRTERQSVCKREFKKRIYIGKRKSLTDLGKHQNLIVTLLSWFSLCFLFLFGIEKGIQILEYIYIQHSLFVLSHYLVIVSLSLCVSLPDKTVRLPKRDRGVWSTGLIWRSSVNLSLYHVPLVLDHLLHAILVSLSDPETNFPNLFHAIKIKTVRGFFVYLLIVAYSM